MLSWLEQVYVPPLESRSMHMVVSTEEAEPKYHKVKHSRESSFTLFSFTLRNFHLVSPRHVLPVMQQPVRVLVLSHGFSVFFEAAVARV